MIENPLELPCGATLKNRIAKAAMTEGIADVYDNPTLGHATLYKTWADGGAGLLITGNVMIDRRYLERAGNVVVDEHTDLEALAAWASAATVNDTHCWMQISHPGRQCAKTSAKQPLAPSAEQLVLAGLYGRPRAMTTNEIRDAIQRFAFVASTAKDCGFTGVQIHSAHGYLGSQFLSPRVNHRTDQWGGSLENRARFLLETVAAVREAVGNAFPISVKLNSADFSRGGFSNEDSAQVARWLSEAGVDLLELSGGTYEQIAFLGELGEPGSPRSASTQAREAFFLTYAKLIRQVTDIPLMVTGGFRTRAAMEAALEACELDVIGVARPFCVVPYFPQTMIDSLVDGTPTTSMHTDLPSYEVRLNLGRGYLGPASSSPTIRGFNSQVGTAWFYQQIIRMSQGLDPDVSLNRYAALIRHLWADQMGARRRTQP